jgi:anti-sigma factor RsiW
MNHDDIVGKLSEYRDGALDSAERERVARHLTECADCASTLSDWESLAAAFLRRAPAATVFQTEAFAARVMARLPAAAPEPLAWLTGRWLMPALGLSFTMLAFSFQPFAAGQAADSASALLLARADRASASAGAETMASDVLGLGLEAEER